MLRRLTMGRPVVHPASEAIRRPWTVLVLAFGIVLLSAAQLAYRFTLPTDGWTILSSEDLDRPDWVYLANLVGAPSELRRDDRLVAVAQGGAIFSPGIAQRVLGYLSVPTPVAGKGVFDELAPREREILEGIAHGRTNAEIAAQLNLSPKTVSNYISNILLKVHATDCAKLMLMALDAGMGQRATGEEPAG